MMRRFLKVLDTVRASLSASVRRDQTSSPHNRASAIAENRASVPRLSVQASDAPSRPSTGVVHAANFRPTVVAAVQELLTEAELDGIGGLCEGIVSIVDNIHSYTEEGVRLFPEVLITTSVEPILSSIAYAKYVRVGNVSDVEEGIAVAIKRCAPLARDGWIIAIQLEGGGGLSYGLFTVEVTNFSASAYRHLVGDLAVEEIGPPLVFIRGLGAKRVEIRTKRRQCVVSVSLRHGISDGREVGMLADVITIDIGDDLQKALRFFFAKALGDALRHTHGCIVAVVRDTPEDVEAFETKYQDGAYLAEPIDLGQAARDSSTATDEGLWMAVRNYRSLLQGMLSHDGITVLTTRGRILGYNVFVPREKTADTLRGGARSRAFQTLCTGGVVVCAIAISQDGDTKFFGGCDA